MNELHVGIIGLGKMGLLHAGILNSLPNVKVQAIADTEKFVINFIKKNTDSIQVYSDYKKMVENSKLDFVYITTPVASHIPIASYCASKKIHFFVEKPLGLNVADCSQLYEIVKQNNVLSMVGFYLRYKETFKKAKAMFDSGILGKTKNINGPFGLSYRRCRIWRRKKKRMASVIYTSLSRRRRICRNWTGRNRSKRKRRRRIIL